MRTLAKEPGRQNVKVVSADVVSLPEAAQAADVLWLHLFYHDLHTALIQAKGATAADFNRAVYDRLKPGGTYVIVDHAAAVGSGTSDAQSLNRIESTSVREEVEAAGFVLDAQSTMLAKTDDPHSAKVFDPSIKGETDRFAYHVGPGYTWEQVLEANSDGWFESELEKARAWSVGISESQPSRENLLNPKPASIRDAAVLAHSYVVLSSAMLEFTVVESIQCASDSLGRAVSPKYLAST